jgi:ferredoxin
VAPGNLLDVALTEDRNITVFSGYCKRVRFRKSNCRICLDVCPENAISLYPGPTINSGCSDCGLCQNACPTEVFQNELYTDQHLLNQARAFLGKDQPPGEKKRLCIRCQFAEGQNNGSLLVPCLGRVTENIFLGAAVSGFDEVELTKGPCSECRLKQGEKLLTDAITTSRVLLESMGLGRFSISVEEREKKKEKEEVFSRREVFSKTSKKVKDKTTSFLHHKEKAIRENVQEMLSNKRETGNGKRRSPRREFLRKLLKPKEGAGGIGAQYKPEFPWKKMEIDEKRCSACGICQALCPTGAIRKKWEHERQLTCFTSSSCTNCFLCKEACPEQAIEFEGEFFLADLLEDEERIVARVDVTSCFLCGEVITAGKSKLCPTCRKRQVQPMHIKV